MQNKGLEYLNRFKKKAWPWMNQCVGCQRIGYKPEMPERIHPGMLAYYLRKYFSALPVNSQGLCQICEKATTQESSNCATEN
jgi:hypothetical protein